MIWSTQVKDGLSVDLISLSVTETYGWVLEEIPSEQRNAEHVEDSISAAQKEFKSWRVHLIPPTIRIIKKDPKLPSEEQIPQVIVKTRHKDGAIGSSNSL